MPMFTNEKLKSTLGKVHKEQKRTANSLTSENKTPYSISQKYKQEFKLFVKLSNRSSTDS